MNKKQSPSRNCIVLICPNFSLLELKQCMEKAGRIWPWILLGCCNLFYWITLTKFLHKTLFCHFQMNEKKRQKDEKRVLTTKNNDDWKIQNFNHTLWQYDFLKSGHKIKCENSSPSSPKYLSYFDKYRIFLSVTFEYLMAFSKMWLERLKVMSIDMHQAPFPWLRSLLSMSKFVM